MKIKQRKSRINSILIALLVLSFVIGGLLIILAKSETKVELIGKSADKIIENYTSTEENASTWDISVNGDGSVVATLSEDGTLTISGTGNMKDWNNSNAVDWYGMKNKIKSVSINNGITNIGKYAFFNCQNVTSVEIPSSVTEIGNDAFYYCKSLIKIEIPNSVTTIGNYAFYHCTSLTSIEIPSSVTSIGSYAFYRCTSLTNIKVNENNINYKDDNGVLYTKDGTEIIKYPEGKTETEYTILNNVKTIGYRAFEYCTSLIKIEIPDSVTKIGSCAFYDCTSLTNIEIPNSVTMIGEQAFESCTSLTNIEIPNSVTTIGNYAFSECTSLTSIEIPSSVTEIGSRAFNSCPSLTNIEVDENNISYKDDNGVLYTKDGTGIIKYPEGKKETEYNILNTTITIVDGAFYNCKSLIKIEIPSSVTEIGSYAFGGCTSLTNIEVNENNISYMDDNGVLYTKDGTEIIKYPEGKTETEYTILNNVKTIGYRAFGYCTSLIKIEIPNSVIEIGRYAFYYCKSLTNIKIPNSVTSIGSFAFYHCTSLTNFDIPDSVTSIGSCAFTGCTVIKLSDRISNIEVPNILKRVQNENDVLYSKDGIEFSNCTIETDKVIIGDGQSYATIKFKSGAFDGLTYIISYNTWDISESEDGTVMATLSGDGILTISGNGKMKSWEWWGENCTAWYGVRNMVKSVIIEDGVINIGNYAFYECYKLNNIEIPSSVTNISDRALYDCSSLTKIKVNENNTKYKDDNGILYTKNGTKIIKYPEGKEEIQYGILNGTKVIGDGAFEKCQNLISIEIPSTVTYIGNSAFYNCYNLTNIEIPNTVTYIGEYAFYSCNSLINIEIPSSIEIIEYEMFAYCRNLKSVKISSNVINIKSYSFEGCTSLTSILIPSSVINIENDAFFGCENLTIICRNGTTAEKYAKENNINYLVIDVINPKTTVDQLIKDFGNVTNYEITDKNGEVITGVTYVGTGYKIRIIEDGVSYILIVAGDTTGDGQADFKDILAINKYRLSGSGLEIEEQQAGDVNEDGKTDLKDIFQINKYRLGTVDEL